MFRVWWLVRNYLFPIESQDLIRQLVFREIRQKFKGSWLGLGWALLTPIAMLVVYTFVFRSVLKAKWPSSEGDSNIEFALQLFAGLIVFTWFSDVVGRAPTLITEQPNMVKKVVFPLSVLPWVSVCASSFFAVLSVLVLITATYISRGGLTIHILTLPLIWLIFVPMLLGFVWLLSALGVYLRDLGHIVSLILNPLMFLSPIFYPATALPDEVQKAMVFNPLASIIDATRHVVLEGQWPDFYSLSLYFCVSCSVAVFGAICFHKMRKGFADVL